VIEHCPVWDMQGESVYVHKSETGSPHSYDSSSIISLTGTSETGKGHEIHMQPFDRSSASLELRWVATFCMTARG